MKKGWKATSFSDVCSIESALVNPREAVYSDLLHVGGANIESSSGVLIDLKKAKDEGLKSGKFLFDDSTVLYSKIRPYLMKVARPEFRGLWSADIYPLTPKPGVLERDYLYHVLLSPEFTDFAVAGSARAGMPKVNRDHLFSYSFLLPPLGEQQRIVGILDEAFEGIATAKANAEKNLQNARALFESHLQSVFTRESDEVPLSEVASDITDGDHSPPPKAPTGVQFITISDIVKRTRVVDFSNTFTVPEEYFQNLRPNKKPRVGDVLYTVTGATLGIPVLVKERRDFCFQRHIGLIRPRPETDSAWLTYALLSPQVFRQATIGSTGAAQKTVSLSVLRNLKVPKLATAEQKRLAARLDKLAAETQRLATIYERKLTALDDLKKSLLHQAFSGQL